MSSPRHARKAPPRTSRSWGQRLLILVGAMLSLALLTAASGVGYVYWRLGQVRVFEDVAVDTVEVPEEPRNYLLVGSDVRSETDGDFGQTVGERSDVLVLVRFDPESKQAYMVSLPRDLWVELPGGGHDRINAVWGDGRQALIDAIRLNLGIDVNHYVEVDMAGVAKLVDAIGGVSMYFDTPMRDGPSGLSIPSAGCAVLDGGMAVAFARARHLEYQTENGWRTDPSGDLGRISRQQVFLRTVLEQAMAKNLLNPVTLNSMLGIALESVGFDPVLGRREALLELAEQLDGFELQNLHSFTVPVEQFRTSGGASVVRLYEDLARPVLNVFRGKDAAAFEKADLSVSVLNGSRVSGQAGLVTDALAFIGFTTTAPGTANRDHDRTTIAYAPGWEAAADLLARHLTSGAVLEEDGSLGPGELLLITGTDFTTVNEQPGPPTTAPPETTTTEAEEEATTTTGSIAGGITTTTLPPPETTSTTVIGVVPGEPPPGVVCS
jgi:LCP family protein required for cell wall assembly